MSNRDFLSEISSGLAQEYWTGPAPGVYVRRMRVAALPLEKAMIVKGSNYDADITSAFRV